MYLHERQGRSLVGTPPYYGDLIKPLGCGNVALKCDRYGDSGVLGLFVYVRLD